MNKNNEDNIYFSKKKRKIYVLSAILPMVVMLVVWMFMGTFPFGKKTQMAVDFGQQYIGLYGFLQDVIVNGDFSALFYSFSKSIGGAMIGIWGFNLISPFNILYILIPKESYSWAIFLTIILRYGATGLAFAFFIVKRYAGLKYPTLYVPIFAMSYALSGMIVSYQMNPIFYDAMIMLPIVLTYLEEFLDGGKPYKYVLTLALTLLLHFYMGYMICLFIAIYSIFYYLPPKDYFKNNIGAFKPYFNKLISLAIYSIIAVGTVFIILLPIVLNLIITKGAYENYLNLKLSFQINPLDILSKLMIGGFDDTGWPKGPNLPNIYAGSVALIGAIYYFINKNITKNRKIGAGIVLSILFLACVNEFVNKLWHMGQTPAGFFYRFSWIISFFIVLLAYQAFIKKDFYSRWVNFSIAGFFVLSAGYVFFNNYSYIAKQQSKETLKELSNYNLLIFIIYVVFIYVIIKKILVNNSLELAATKVKVLIVIVVVGVSYLLLINGYLLTQIVLTLVVWLLAMILFNREVKKSILIGATIILSIEMGYNAYLSQNTISYDNSPRFADATENFGNLIEKVKTRDSNGFYRIGSTFTYSRNDPFLHNYNGLSTFSSNLEKATVDLFGYIGDIGGNAATFFANGTPLTDDLFSVKYFLYSKPYTNEDLKNNPDKKYFQANSTRKDLDDRYNKIYEDDRFVIYERDNVLPIAFGTKSSILDIKLEKNKPYLNQNLILSALGKQDDYFINVGIPTVELENMKRTDDKKKLTYERIDDSKKAKAVMNLKIDDNNTHYFLAPLQLRSSIGNTEIQLDNKWYYYSQSFDQAQLWNVAHNDAGKTLKLSFSPKKEKILDLTGLNLYKINAEKIDKIMDERKKQGLNVDKWSNNTVEGTINITDDSNLVFTSIPFNPGWQVKVDGKEVKTVPVLESLMAFPISAGEHKIEMKFIPQGLKLGAAVSLVSILFLLIVLYYDKKKNKMLI